MKLQVIKAISVWNHSYRFENAVNDFPFNLLAYGLVRIAQIPPGMAPFSSCWFTYLSLFPLPSFFSFLSSFPFTFWRTFSDPKDPQDTPLLQGSNMARQISLEESLKRVFVVVECLRGQDLTRRSQNSTLQYRPSILKNKNFCTRRNVILYHTKPRPWIILSSSENWRTMLFPWRLHFAMTNSDLAYLNLGKIDLIIYLK